MGSNIWAEAKKIPALEKVLRGETGQRQFVEDTCIMDRTRELVDVWIDKNTQAAVVILNETYKNSRIHSVVIGAYFDGRINYKHIDCQDNPGREYSKITNIQVYKHTCPEVCFKAVSKSQRISGSFKFL